MSEESVDKTAGARDYYEWYEAYLAAGFSSEQAMAILTRPAVTYSVNTSYPPELYEHLERQTALANKMLTDMDD